MIEINKLIINWRKEIIGLFPDVTERTLEKREVWCPRCNGLGLIRKENYVVGCATCQGKGVIKNLCECGKEIDFRGRDKCFDCSQEEFRQREAEKDRERFKVAQKVSFADYDGLFLWGERVVDKDDLVDKLWANIYEDEPQRWIWGAKKSKHFSKIDLYEVMSNYCEDGYEDMICNFDFKDPLILMAGNLLKLWLDKHDRYTDIYCEDYGTVVLLDDLIAELLQELRAER